MKWIKLTIHTTTEAEDLLSAMLQDLGMQGIEIEDNVPLTESETKGMFIDILPELPPDEGKARVSCYLQEGDDIEAEKQRISEAIEELRTYVNCGEGTIEVSETEDKDWINNWKAFFKPFCVDEILIKPTWEEIPPEHKDKMMIEIDPGTAFGTGSHETTRLCIRQIQKYMKAGDKVMDIGTGSGILSIACMKLGASQVFATDVDEYAVAAAKENVEVNHLPADQITMITGDIISDKAVQDLAGYECYDFAVANILAPVIIMLQEEIARHLKHGSYFGTSGIINTMEEAVKDAFDRNPEWEYIDSVHDNDWVSVIARRK